MNNNKGIRTYHYQANKDIFAEVPDLSDRIISTTFKEIFAAYRDDLLSDLMLEAQEAY